MLLLRTIRTFLVSTVGMTCMLVVCNLIPVASAQIVTEPTLLPEGIAATGDTTEVRALTAWAEEHRSRSPQDAERIAQRALTLARNLDDQRGIGVSLSILGSLVQNSDPYQAEVYYIGVREAFTQIGDVRAIARNSINLGVIYSDRGDFREALTHYLDALDGLERLGDTEATAVVLINISNIYITQNNLNEALLYLEKADALVESLQSPILIISISASLGNTLAAMGSYERAEMILGRGLTIAEEQGDGYYILMSSNNLGALFNKQGRYQSALPLLLTAERWSNELGDTRLMAAVWDELGKAYMGLGQYNRALHYAYESLTLAQEAGSASRQMEAYETLSRIYDEIGNYEQAFIHHRLYASARDSVFTGEWAEIIAEMQARYETEEARRTNERLEQEIRISTLQAGRRQAFLLTGIAVMLLITGSLYARYRLNKKANRMLKELDMARSRFFANISHEFRTPLTVMLGGLEDLQAGRFGQVTEEVAGQHNVILRNTHQLQGLIDEVLDLNRLESGRLEFRQLPGDVVEFLQRLVEAHSPLAERHGVELIFEHGDIESCLRLYDAEKLEKIVGNLLSNALKFTPKDGSVRLSLDCGKQTAITVSDEGPGIPLEARSSVFDRFTQLDHGMLKGGSGIGLALAKELTELHGGTLTLESLPGEGSTFTVRLPLEKVATSDLRADLVSSPELNVGGDGYGVPGVFSSGSVSQNEVDRTTVLLIEDNDDVRAYVRRSLEERYRILAAIDGETGLQRARADLPDLIVSDVMLPGMSGYDVVRRLKAEAATECIPVIMLTARVTDEDQIAGYGSGAEIYLTKPFSAESLQAATSRLLEERRRLRRRLQNEVTQDKGISGNGIPTLPDRARAIVLEHLYDERFDVEKLASNLGMSRRTLHRQLKQEMDLSPSDFIRVLRLEQARELLANGTSSVSEVAYAVGFNSLIAFSRAYRTHYGVPPSSHFGIPKEVAE